MTFTHQSGTARAAGADSSPPYLRLRSVTKQYPTGGGVAGVDLTVAKGDMLVLLGPSGCGKTTLLRTLAGLLQPDSGGIELDGEDLVAVPTFRRNISMVFQTWALFPTMTVRDNVAFGLRMRRVGRQQRSERVARALELVGLTEFADRLPRQLSGGQQQRVAVARAIVVEPRLILMDEPLSSLDHRIRVQLRAQLKQLQRGLGLTGVYVTHDHTEALALGDRIAVMDSGRIVELGRPVDVFARPTRRYTAEFLGLANVVDVTADGGGYRTADGAPIPGDVTGGRSDVVAVALRPDCVRLSQTDDGGAAGVVRVVEYQPGGVLHDVELPGGARLQALTPVGLSYSIDTPVFVTPEWSKAVPLAD